MTITFKDASVNYNRVNIRGSDIKVTELPLEVTVEYAQRRQYDQALQIVQSLDSDIFKGIAVDPRQARTLSEIVARMAQAELAERAVHLLDQALEVAKFIQHEADKVDALVAIASQYATVGQPAKASQRVSG